MPGVAACLTEAYHGTLRKVMFSAANGFSVNMGAQDALALSNEPQVLLVEENGYAGTSALVDTPWWHLDRINQPFGLDGKKTDCPSGAGVTVYVVDTGVNKAHSEFQLPGGGSKVLDGVDFADDRDINGNLVAYPYPVSR